MHSTYDKREIQTNKQRNDDSHFLLGTWYVFITFMLISISELHTSYICNAKNTHKKASADHIISTLRESRHKSSDAFGTAPGDLGNSGGSPTTPTYSHILLRNITYYYVLLRITTTYYYILLRITTYYYVLLRTSTYYYVLTRPTANNAPVRHTRARYYYVILRITTYYYVPPRTTTYYYVFLRTPTYTYVLLRTITYYYVLLRTTTYYYVLLRTTAYYYVLLRIITYSYVLLRTNTHLKRRFPFLSGQV